jgi:hypothetical protein
MAKIELPVARDFGQLIGDPFLFFRQNFKLLGRAFLFFVVPMLLVATVFTAFGMKNVLGQVFSPSRYQGSSSGADPNTAWLGAGYLFFFLIAMFQQMFLSQFMVLYHQNKETTINETFGALRTNWKNILVTFIIYVLMGALLFAVTVGGVILADEVGRSIAGFVVFILYMGFIYIAVPLSNLMMVRLREDLDIGAAISKCFQITLGKWWRSFGGFWAILGIYYSLILAAFIPFYAFVLFIYFNRLNYGNLPDPTFMTTAFSILMTSLVFWSAFVGQLFYLYSGINYFSLSEAYDHYELRKQIQNIGVAHQIHYDKQEGEY